MASVRQPSLAVRLAISWLTNAIVLANEETTLAIGAGQTSRVDAVRIALDKAAEPVSGAVLASDSYFAFADAPQLAIDAGVTAIIQPGGSVKDKDSIAACDEHGARGRE